MEEKKRKLIAVDEDVHSELKIIAARRKVSIKQYLREMVEAEKAINTLLPKPEFPGD